jgi:hypothetical protein
MYRANGVWVNPRKLADHYADAEKLCLLAADYAGYKRTITGATETTTETQANGQE